MQHAGRRYQPEARRQQLLDTAVACFAREGVENTSIKELAQAAGVAQGLLYHYFPSKDDLLLAALDRHNFRDEMRAILSPAEDRPVADVLLELATRFDALLAAREALTRVLLRQAMIQPAVAERWTSMVQEANDLLAGFLDARVAAGELQPHDTRATAAALLYTVYMQHLTRVPEHLDMEALIENLLRGIGVGKD
jgi:AcrR family transcriptional regulator